jgi:hypothetical protein
VCFAAELAGIELETIAEDADRLEIKAQGGGVTPVGAPKELPEVEEPKALPPPQADPLLMRVLKDSGQAPEPAPAPAVEKPPQEAEIDRSVEEALPPEPTVKATQCQGCGTMYHADREGCPECGVLKGEAPPTKKRKSRRVTGKKPGDLIRNGTRRVVEVDEEGTPTVVEKVKPPKAAEPSEEEKPTHCPRASCRTKLNLIGQCDNCGWPTAMYG